MKQKGIIFDLDGVIVFTDKYHYLAWKFIADKMNIYFDEEMNNQLRGVGRMESLEIILRNYSGEPLSKNEKEKLADQKNSIYRESLSRMNPNDVSDEVRDTLTYLRNKGMKLSIGSSSKNAKYILERVDLARYFDAISDGSNITKSKPDPEVFLKAAEFLDCAPDECAVVEDACAGIDAAKAGKMLAIGIGDAALYEKTDIKINTFSELKKLF